MKNSNQSLVFFAVALLIVAFFLSACGSIRLRYDSEVQTPDGKIANYVYEKSYEVPLHPTLCGLTAIFFGGDCWYYFVMPTTLQGQLITSDGQKVLDKKLKTKDYKLNRERTSRVSWTDSPESSSLTYSEQQ